MLRQSFSTSSRALRSNSRPFAQAAAALIRTQPAPAPPLTPAWAALRGGRVPGRAVVSAPASRVRWYSDKAETAEKKEGEGETSQAEAQSAESAPKTSDVEAELRKKLEAKEKEVIEWKDKCLRSIADFRNLQERSQREMKAARDFAIQKFAKDLVDSVDNLDRALSMGQEKLKALAEGEGNANGEKAENPELQSFYEGVKMTETNMMQTLQKHGLERFDPEGHKFNPNEHEATFMTPMPDKEDNTVFHVQQKGFKLNGRILRAAKVGVVKNPEAQS